MLSKGEANYKNNNYNKNSKPASGTEMALMIQIFKNPSFMNITKILSKDEKMLEHLNKMPEIQELQKTNPIYKKALKNPELMKKITNPEIIETFNEMALIIDEDKKDKEKENKEKENNNINDLKTLEDKFNYLKNMGFKDDKLIEEALLVCEENIDAAIEYINSLKKEEGK